MGQGLGAGQAQGGFPGASRSVPCGHLGASPRDTVQASELWSRESQFELFSATKSVLTHTPVPSHTRVEAGHTHPDPSPARDLNKHAPSALGPVEGGPAWRSGGGGVRCLPPVLSEKGSRGPSWDVVLGHCLTVAGEVHWTTLDPHYLAVLGDSGPLSWAHVMSKDPGNP